METKLAKHVILSQDEIDILSEAYDIIDELNNLVYGNEYLTLVDTDGSTYSCGKDDVDTTWLLLKALNADLREISIKEVE
jgi:hypothetical protein